MARIVIEKFADGELQKRLRLPLWPVRVLARLLLQKARRDLLARGLDLDAILDGLAPGDQWLSVREGRRPTRIRVSRDDRAARQAAS